MKRMISIIVFTTMIIFLVGCNKTQNTAMVKAGSVEVLNMIDSDYPQNVDYYLYYEKNIGSKNFKTKTYCVNNKAIYETDETYQRSYSSIYSEQHAQSIIGKDNVSNEQILICDQTKSFDFVVTSAIPEHNSNIRNWKIYTCSKIDKNQATIVIESDGIQFPEAYYIQNDTLFIYTPISNESTSMYDMITVYSIDLSSNQTKKHQFDTQQQPYNQLVNDVKSMCVIDDQLFLIGAHIPDTNYIEEHPTYATKYKFDSYIMSVNFITKEMYFLPIKDFYTCKIFSYEDRLAIVKTDKETETNLVIDFYDYTLKSEISNTINIPLNKDKYILNVSSVSSILLRDKKLFFTAKDTQYGGIYIMIYDIEYDTFNYMSYVINSDTNYYWRYCNFTFKNL